MDKLTNIASSAIDAMKNAGANMAVAVAKTSETKEFNVDGGKFSLFRTLFDNSLRLISYKGGKKGSVGINSFDEADIEKASSDCIASAESASPDEAWDIAPEVNNQSFSSGAIEPDLDKLFFRSKELVTMINERHPKIIIEQMIVTHVSSKSVYLNTKGARFEEREGSYNLSLMYSAHEGEKCTSFFGSGFTAADLDRPFIEYATVEKDLSDVEDQLETTVVNGKFTGTVIARPGSMYDIVGAALSSFASDRPILESTSIWKDSLGKAVASDSLTVSMAPLDGRIVCGERVTADGFASENYDIIKDGILTGFMLSLYVANKTGLPRAANSSFSWIIEPGETPLSEMIAGIERGIILGRFSGGEPSSNGDFSGVAKNSFLIEGGKIVGALSETMISGNLADALMNVRAISEETVCDGGSVLPYIAFDGITVSGAEA